RAMERDHLAEVGLPQRIAVQREEAALQLTGGERDPTTRVEWLVLHRIPEAQAVVLLAEVALELLGEVAAGELCLLDTVSCPVLERVREERPVDQRQHVLPSSSRQRSEPRALPAHEDDCRQAHEPLRGS